MKNSPYVRCYSLPQYFILMKINEVYGIGAFDLRLLDRYTIRAKDECGKTCVFRWDIHTKQIVKEEVV